MLLQRLIVRLLIVRDYTQYVVHLIATLFRLQSALVGMGQIDVNQIGEKETQIGDAGQAEALEIGPQIRPVVLVAEYITEALEGVAILLR